MKIKKDDGNSKAAFRSSINKLTIERRPGDSTGPRGLWGPGGPQGRGLRIMHMSPGRGPPTRSDTISDWPTTVPLCPPTCQYSKSTVNVYRSPEQPSPGLYIIVLWKIYFKLEPTRTWLQTKNEQLRFV